MIVGIDEVGRGAWAGPVVVAAAVIDPLILDGAGGVIGLNDSKLLTKKRRDALVPLIRLHAAWIGIGWVSAKQIDAIGMSAALKLAAERAVERLPAEFNEIIIDGTIRLLERENVSTLKKADQIIPSVMAASVIAKVARDTYMEKLATIMPEYGFEKHVGYGTAYHQAQIEAHGVSKIHRASFAPMRGMLAGEATVPRRATLTTGAKAEIIAADWLKTHGYEILGRNWKTKLCEIDIVACKDQTIYFVEAKYRASAHAGSGMEYITAKKLAQMIFAAEAWRHLHKWTGAMQLAAIELAGTPIKVTKFVSDIHAS